MDPKFIGASDSIFVMGSAYSGRNNTNTASLSAYGLALTQVESNGVLIGRTAGNTYWQSLNPNGTLRWQYPVSTGYAYFASVGSDGTTFLQDKNITAIRPDGTVAWTYPRTVGNTYNVAPAVGPDGTLYAVDNYSGNEMAIDPNGTIKWSHRVNVQPQSIMVDRLGNTYCWGVEDGLEAVDANGNMLWHTPGKPLDLTISTILADDSTILSVSGRNSILAQSTIDGHTLWSYTFNSSFNLTGLAPGGADRLYALGYDSYTDATSLYVFIPEPSSLLLLLASAPLLLKRQR